MASSATPPISRIRKLLAGASMFGAAGLIATEITGVGISRWPALLSFAALYAVAGVGITRRSLVPQILSRGAAWVVLLPALLVSGFALADGQAPPFEVAGLGLATGSALLLARPMLHTREAREQFSPKVFRSWLLAGSTATAATGFVVAGVALGSLLVGGLSASFVGALALAMSLVASAIGVVRMRAWGIFLGALTSAAMMVTAFFVGNEEAVLLSLAAAPAMLMHVLPVLVARWSNEAVGSTNVRVADDVKMGAYPVVHHRIAADDAADVEDVDTGESTADRAALRA